MAESNHSTERPVVALAELKMNDDDMVPKCWPWCGCFSESETDLITHIEISTCLNLFAHFYLHCHWDLDYSNSLSWMNFLLLKERFFLPSHLIESESASDRYPINWHIILSWTANYPAVVKELPTTLESCKWINPQCHFCFPFLLREKWIRIRNWNFHSP